MITITDSAGHSLTLDDAELTVTEIISKVEDWKQGHHPDLATFTVRTAYDAPIRINTNQMQTFDAHEVHAPAPTSARWEGPPPRRARR